MVSSSTSVCTEAENGFPVTENTITFASVPQMICQVALSTPHAPAVVSGTELLTYEELNDRANRIAKLLACAGISTQRPVGLYLDRSAEFIIAALGVLKVGGTYVPLDPLNPIDRITFMIQDAGVRALVTTSAAEPLLAELKLDVCIRVGPAEIPAEKCDNFTGVATNGGDIAYVIYTSGSTGQPKGVEITHHGLMNLIRWHQRAFSVTAADHASHLACVGFDAAGWEIWPYLTKGASLYIANDQTRADPEKLRDWFLENDVTIAFVPTPVAERLFELEWPSTIPLRVLLTGGDALQHYPGAHLPFRVFNNYGPTETTVVATSGPVPVKSGISQLPSIGRPIDNTQVYILDDRLEPVPVGAVGEMYIGGDGVARGYHGQPELTASRFTSDKFRMERNGRLYRTGDLGSYLPTGEIAFHGRVDDQVKVNGYRIEPSEVSAILNRHVSVAAGTVAACANTKGENQLLAYVVPSKNKRPTGTELREFLRQHLPDYMVPSAFFEISALPLTAHGKIDRKALPCVNSANLLREDFVSATTPVQEKLLSILKSLLGIRDISLNDNFFLLGGHSLLGAQLIAKVRQDFGVKLTLRNLFGNPTVAGMAAEIERLMLANSQQQCSSASS
jgi:amino acid adenylation domain-containing protein